MYETKDDLEFRSDNFMNWGAQTNLLNKRN